MRLIALATRLRRRPRHLHRGDYARWFREAIKDNDDLADAAEAI